MLPAGECSDQQEAFLVRPRARTKPVGTLSALATGCQPFPFRQIATFAKDSDVARSEGRMAGLELSADIPRPKEKWCVVEAETPSTPQQRFPDAEDVGEASFLEVALKPSARVKVNRQNINEALVGQTA